MINNSALQKWDRLAQKQLDHQFMNEIMQGLQCSPFEAGAILDTVYKVMAKLGVKSRNRIVSAIKNH